MGWGFRVWGLALNCAFDFPGLDLGLKFCVMRFGVQALGTVLQAFF